MWAASTWQGREKSEGGGRQVSERGVARVAAGETRHVGCQHLACNKLK